MPVEIKQHTKYYLIMSYSFEYIDIILLAMIAGFIFLRLRSILGRKSGFEDEVQSNMKISFLKKQLKIHLNKVTLMKKQKKIF